MATQLLAALYRALWATALYSNKETRPFQRLRLHQARHTCASFMIAAGVNPKALPSFTGHSSINATFDLYGDLMPGTEVQAAALLDTFLGAEVEADEQAARQAETACSGSSDTYAQDAASLLEAETAARHVICNVHAGLRSFRCNAANPKGERLKLWTTVSKSGSLLTHFRCESVEEAIGFVEECGAACRSVGRP